MKKIVLASLVAFMLLSACGGAGSNKSQATSTEVNKDSIEGANNNIIYLNKIIDYTNSVNKWFDARAKSIYLMVEKMEKSDKTYDSNIGGGMRFAIQSYKGGTPPESLTTDEQAFFQSHMEAYIASADSLKKVAELLEKYILYKDFDEDNFKAGKAMAEQIKAQLAIMTQKRSETSAKIDEVADKAEVVLLANHPFRDPILAMREDLKLIKQLSYLFEEYSHGNADPAEIEALYKKTYASYELHKDAFKDILEKNTLKKDRYQTFYNDFEPKIKSARETVNERIVKNKKLDSWNFISVEMIVHDYNYFVQ